MQMINSTDRLTNMLNTSRFAEEKTNIGIMVYVISMSVAVLFAFVSNCLVIYCVVRFTSLRTVTNIFICNLSVSDILLAGFVMPQRLHDVFHDQLFYHEGEILCKVINFFPIVVISSSIYTLVAVSFERRQVMLDSQAQVQRISNRKVSAVIVTIWVIALGVSSPSSLEYTVQEIGISANNESSIITSCGSQFTQTQSLANGIFVCVMSYVVPVILLSKNYTELAIFVWKRGKWIREHFVGSVRLNSTSVRLFKQRTRLVKLLFLVAVIFAVSWFPFFVILIYAKVTGNDASENASGVINLLLIALAIFSTAYNVVLYVVFNPSFKQAIAGIIKCTSTTEVNLRVGSAETQQSPVSPQDTPLSAEASGSAWPGSSANLPRKTTNTSTTELG